MAQQPRRAARRRSLPPIAAAAAIFAVLATPALADRDPTPLERNAIEAALVGFGFVRWGDIELEDDGITWEVDDARGGDGRQYDLKLDRNTLAVIESEVD